MDTKELAWEIESNLDYEYGGHSLYYGSYNPWQWQKNKAHISLIWTQIGHGEENDGNPAVDIEVNKTYIKVKAEKEHKLLLKNYDLNKKTSLKKLKKDIDSILENYYSQWIEQPRFVRKK